MFIHETHLPQVLSPADFTSPDQYERELSELFLDHWHLVGTLAELPRDGDYLTLELLGRPLIVWRMEGEVHAFLNVCAHRFATLTDKQRGHLKQLRCQYHGWEYDTAGCTRKIPDAQNFRPMTKGSLGLCKYRTVLCGQLIFVNLSEGGRSLAETLDWGYGFGESIFSSDWRLILSIERQYEANWKILQENSLEGYHSEAIHPRTFKIIPKEETCGHRFGERWTLYTEDIKGRDDWLSRLGELIYRPLGRQHDYQYKHLHCYPNTIFAEMAVLSWVQVSLPLGPTRSRNVWRLFAYAGHSSNPLAKLSFLGLRTWGRWFFNTVVGEDEVVYPAVQRGLSSAVRPEGGLISRREERIFHFQEFIKAATANGSTNHD
jgi:phenylpropionate dioxygenase-like ring-hydroxylating dioxygenase large terminal subunit